MWKVAVQKLFFKVVGINKKSNFVAICTLILLYNLVKFCKDLIFNSRFTS